MQIIGFPEKKKQMDERKQLKKIGKENFPGLKIGLNLQFDWVYQLPLIIIEKDIPLDISE